MFEAKMAATLKTFADFIEKSIKDFDTTDKIKPRGLTVKQRRDSVLVELRARQMAKEILLPIHHAFHTGAEGYHKAAYGENVKPFQGEEFTNPTPFQG